MKRQLLFGALLGMTLTGALLGCGGGGDSTENPTPTPAPTATPTPTPTPTPAPGNNRTIVFASSASGSLNDQEIYIMAADGTFRTRLTTNSLLDDDPALSPDGTKILFIRRDDTAQPNIYIMNVDGSDQRRILALGTNLFEPRWSGNGSKFVFWDFSRRVWTANADGSGATQVPNATSADSPALSPDGTKIAYSHSTERDLYVINVDGTGKTKITATAGTKEYRPRWSPDGSKLVYFTETEGSPSQIVTSNANGNGTTVVRTEANTQNPDWSNDGTKIVFENWNSEQLFTMNADGTGVANLTNGVGKDTNASW